MGRSYRMPGGGKQKGKLRSRAAKNSKKGKKNDEDEIFNGTGSRHALRKMSQRKGRSSPDLHGFSRVAASVFDDDPFFNDEDPGGSDFSETT